MAATMTVTFNGVAIEMTSDDPEELVRMTSLLTALEGPAKNAPKGRKETTKKAAPKVRTVRTANLVAFGEAIGANLEGWTLEELLDSLREYGEAGSLRMDLRSTPKGWTFGPKSKHYLVHGTWE